MPKPVIATILERGCVIALGPSFTGVLTSDANLESAIQKINATPLDTTLGDDRATRHVQFTPDEARALVKAFQATADRANIGGDKNPVQACAEAVDNIKHALLVAGESN